MPPAERPSWVLTPPPPRWRFNAVHWPGKAPAGKGGQFAPAPNGPAGHKPYVEPPPADVVPDVPDDLVQDGLGDPTPTDGGDGPHSVSVGHNSFAVGVVGKDLADKAKAKNLPADHDALFALATGEYPQLTDQQKNLALTEAFKHLHATDPTPDAVPTVPKNPPASTKPKDLYYIPGETDLTFDDIPEL